MLKPCRSYGLPGTLQCNATARPKPLPRMCQARRKAHKFARRATDKKSILARQAKKDFLKLTERHGNVYESKGPLWKTWGRTGNVYQNKDSWLFKPGM